MEWWVVAIICGILGLVSIIYPEIMDRIEYKRVLAKQQQEQQSKLSATLDTLCNQDDISPMSIMIRQETQEILNELEKSEVVDALAKLAEKSPVRICFAGHDVVVANISHILELRETLEQELK